MLGVCELARGRVCVCVCVCVSVGVCRCMRARVCARVCVCVPRLQILVMCNKLLNIISMLFHCTIIAVEYRVCMQCRLHYNLYSTNKMPRVF